MPVLQLETLLAHSSPRPIQSHKMAKRIYMGSHLIAATIILAHPTVPQSRASNMPVNYSTDATSMAPSNLYHLILQHHWTFN